jgi:hypothetical protein
LIYYSVISTKGLNTTGLIYCSVVSAKDSKERELVGANRLILGGFRTISPLPLNSCLTRIASLLFLTLIIILRRLALI